MRQLLAIGMLCVTAACASSHTATPSLRQQCEDSFDRVWMAAQSALLVLGGETVSANRPAGTIHGRIASDLYGAEIELGITVRRTPDTRIESVEPLWVEVRTWDPSTTEPDPERLEDLRLVARQFLTLIQERAACGSPM